MKTSLLIRFRWPILIVMWVGGIMAGVAYHFNNTDVTQVGIVVALFAASTAVVLNTVDETTNDIER